MNLNRMKNFKSLIVNENTMDKSPQKRKRKCLRCRVEFISEGFHNCVCGACNAVNSRLSKRAQEEHLNRLDEVIYVEG